MISIFWFRRDLRLSDNTAFFKALQSGKPVLPIFIFDKEILSKLPEIDARVDFIHQTVSTLKAELEHIGSSLKTYFGNPLDVWKEIVNTYTLSGVFFNEDYEPQAIERDFKLIEFLKSHQIQSTVFTDQVIYKPGTILKEDGSPYTVFTPFSKKWKLRLSSDSITQNPSEKLLSNTFKTQPFDLITLESMGFKKSAIQLPPSTVSDDVIKLYHETRNYPGNSNGTSHLGLHLRFGTISVRSLTAKAQLLNETFLNELIWREFYMNILFHFPQVVNKSFKPAYDLIQWETNESHFNAWCQGKTGVPIVDAGMRELVKTGYMHNRVRMIVASYFTKNLLLNWRLGEAFFAKHLLDFELASNNGGWQWAAGCGTDAAPYFRIFNPMLQTEKFDGERTYINKWVPEWQSLAYPKPLVDFNMSRTRCLERYKIALTGQSSLL